MSRFFCCCSDWAIHRILLPVRALFWQSVRASPHTNQQKMISHRPYLIKTPTKRIVLPSFGFRSVGYKIYLPQKLADGRTTGCSQPSRPPTRWRANRYSQWWAQHVRAPHLGWEAKLLTHGVCKRPALFIYANASLSSRPTTTTRLSQ